MPTVSFLYYQVLAVDADSENFAIVRYSISGEGTEDSFPNSVPARRFSKYSRSGPANPRKIHRKIKRLASMRHNSANRLRGPRRSSIVGDLLDPGGHEEGPKMARLKWVQGGPSFSINSASGTISVLRVRVKPLLNNLFC